MATLDSLAADLALIKAHLGIVPVDLDGKYGNPVVKFDPKDWHGEACKGLGFRDCPSEYLELLAKSFDYFAKKNDEKGEKDSKGNPKSKWDRQSAALARGWAERNRQRSQRDDAGIDTEVSDF